VLRTVAAALVVHTDRKRTIVDADSTSLTGGVDMSAEGPVNQATEWVVTLADDGHAKAIALAGGPRSFAVAAVWS